MLSRTTVAFMFATLLALAAFGVAVNGQSQKTQPETEEINVHYGHSTITGYGLRGSKTGITIATVPSAKDGRTTMVISIASSRKERDLADLQVVAIAKSGKELIPVNMNGASGTGRQHRVITFVCEFSSPSKDIDRIIVQPKAKNK